MNITDLPTDVLHEILVQQYTPGTSVNAVGCTCKTFSKFVTRTTLWKAIVDKIYKENNNMLVPSHFSGYKEVVTYMQAKPVDGLQIILSADRDTIKYGETIQFLAILKNVSKDSRPIWVKIGTERGNSFTGALYTLSHTLDPAARYTQFNLVEYNDRSDITSHLPPKKTERFVARARLAQQKVRHSPEEVSQKLTLDFAPNEGRRWFDPFLPIFDLSTNEVNNTHLMPDIMTVFVRIELDLTDRNMTSDYYRVFNNVVYSNILPIKVNTYHFKNTIEVQ